MPSLLARLFLVLALLSATQAAHAGPAEDQVAAEKLVQGGLVDARAGRFRDAIAKFEAAYKLYPRPEIQHNLARAHEELKEYKQAYAYFSKACEQDYPFAEDGRKRLAAISDLLRKTHAPLTVKVTPSQVNVHLRFADGTQETHTSTPIQTWAPAGKVEIAASNPRFEPRTERRELAAGIAVTVDLVLAPILQRGFIAINVSEPGARVSISGVEVGRSPLPALPLTAGTHLLEVSLPGFATRTETVVVTPDQVTTVSVILREDASAGPRAEVPWLGWTLTGTGAAFGITALVLQFGKALPLERSARTREEDPDPTEYNRLVDRAYKYETAAIITGAAGLVMTASGVLLVLSHEDEPASAWAPTFSITPAGAHVGGVLRF